MKPEVLHEILSWAKTIVFAVIFAFFINNVVIVNATVPSGSMENTIMEDDRIVAFRLAYAFDTPERFDIIVFPNPDDEKILFVKRVIGLPGETIAVKDGTVYINDEILDDTELLKEIAVGDAGPFTIPAGHYFAMGDNRNTSWDSRYWQNKYVDEEKILGRVVLRYFPNIKVY